MVVRGNDVEMDSEGMELEGEGKPVGTAGK